MDVLDDSQEVKTLFEDEKITHGHRVILAAQSQFFRKLIVEEMDRNRMAEEERSEAEVAE